MPPFSKVLVANRGEIAIRVFRTLRELGIGTIAVYSEADRASLHVEYADEAYLIGPPPAGESYLKIERILETAGSSGAEAIHPGYGFLAENAGFARACADAGVVWIGPPPEAIDAMGSNVEARERMKAAGVPIIPGNDRAGRDGRARARAGGGDRLSTRDQGGVGRRRKGAQGGPLARRGRARAPTARREGEAYFADPTVYVERFLEDPRHVEVQVLADAHGNVVHLGERDCTIQRRHQKLVEETPSPAVSAELRERSERSRGRAARSATEAQGRSRA